MRQLVRYLTYIPRWRRLPKIPRQYSTEWTADQVDPAAEELMRLTRIRSPQGVHRLMRRYQAQSVRELIDKLPPTARRRGWRRVRKRWASLLRRVFGLSEFDPMASIRRDHDPELKRKRRL